MTVRVKARPPVKDIDQAEMLAMFDYREDAKTGRLFWKDRRGGTAKAGSRAGSLGANGYRCVHVDGVGYGEHRIIYTMLKGEIPPGKEINHIDQNKSNNRIDNLRLDTHLDNVRHGTGIARRAATAWKPIFCHENGTTYPSIKEAAEKLNLKATSISKVLNNKLKTTGGKTFSFITTTVTNPHLHHLDDSDDD